jgi:hypothetical protein
MHSNDSRLRSHRSVVLAALLLLSLVVPTVSGAGPIGWNLSGGRYDNLAGTDHPYFVGLGPRVSLGSIILAPNAEWLFVDAGQVYTLNLDAAMVVVPAGVASAWVGGGVGFRTVKPDHLDATTDRTLNLLAGAGLNLVPMKPYAQLKWVIEDGQKPVAISAGVRF